MSFYVYILLCVDGSYYTGQTDNLEARIAAHRAGDWAGYTHSRRPVTLVFTQEFPTRYEALSSERHIKGWTRAKKQALIAGDWQRLAHWSKRQRQGSALDQPSSTTHSARPERNHISVRPERNAVESKDG